MNKLTQFLATFKRSTKLTGVQESVIIGKQTWTKTNLSISKFRNGETIPQVKKIKDWETAFDHQEPVWCYYDFNTSIGSIYGKIYNWYAVNDKRVLAPIGWRVPSSDDWDFLCDYYPAPEQHHRSKAGGKLKEAGFAHWISPNKGADNLSGFTGLPGGVFTGKYHATFRDLGYESMWWSSTAFHSFEAFFCSIKYDTDEANLLTTARYHGAYVRCIKE